MVSKEYSEAAVEVLDILKHVDNKNVKKIPAKFIEFLEENKSKDYVCSLDHTKTIKEMQLKPKTEAILGFIYIKYWADEEGKKKFKQRMKENEEFFENEVKQNFDKDVFNKESIEETKVEIEENNLPEEYKKVSFVQKLVNKIRSIFGGN